MKLALFGEYDVLRTTAAQRLNTTDALKQVALHATDREVLKISLGKLKDKAVLDAIAGSADDRPMRLAAAQKIGTKTWEQIFTRATTQNASPNNLGDALAAVALFPKVQANAVEGVHQASLNLIRRGDESRIPEMVDLLEGYGDKRLAEDYVNCSQPDLDAAARSWAQRRGYRVDTGSGSHRARWGKGN